MTVRYFPTNPARLGLSIVSVVLFAVAAPASADDPSSMVSDIRLMQQGTEPTRDIAKLHLYGPDRSEWNSWFPISLMTPEQVRQPFEGRVYLVLAIAAEGVVKNCEILRFDVEERQAIEVCRILRERAKFASRYREVGVPVSYESNFTVHFRNRTRKSIAEQKTLAVPPPMYVPPGGRLNGDPRKGWPRRWQNSELTLIDVPSLQALIPRNAKPRGRTSIDLTISALHGVEKCEIGVSSGQVQLDEMACEVGRKLRFQYFDLVEQDRTGVLPLQFVWDKKQSHIRVPLPSNFRAAQTKFDPLDTRRVRIQLPDEVRTRVPSVEPTPFVNLALTGDPYRKGSIEVTVDAEGRASTCVTRKTTEAPNLDAAICKVLLSRQLFQPGYDVFGDAVPTKTLVNFDYAPYGLHITYPRLFVD